ncbi:TraR/DksA family transcriptional regulator [Emcibacter sp.]|uniref:TraR/DksA family transcriptional regulator n=1 Tax=Emcibacter sp. TaxID=1979954 RepID=UPI003B63CC3C
MDDADRAQLLEEHHRARSLHQQLNAASSAGPHPLDCAGCGEAIPAERLAAYPNATRCVDCQEEKEREPLVRSN